MRKKNRGTIRIGISGWRYAPWRGVFYPSGLPQREELAFASQRLATIEICRTTPRPRSRAPTARG